MTVFDEAKTEWNILLANRAWASPVFGDTYYIRYPIEAGTAEAVTYKKSIYKGDDTVHAWDAKGVRQKIIQRIIETQERTIRPWYGELSFFADQIKFLPPLPESELDFILRTSFESSEENQLFYEERNLLLSVLDPEITEPEIEEKKLIYQITRPEDRAKSYARVQIEIYGLLNTIKEKMFVLTDEELNQIIEMLLDVEQADKFLVKRFIEINMREEDMKPFIGQNNPEIRLKTNFLLKYIGGGSPEYYKYRLFQLWLRNLLDFDKQAIEYIERVKSDLLKEFPDEEEIKASLLQAIKIFKLEFHIERLSTLFKNEYAKKLDFNGYMSEVIHLINSRNELFSEPSPALTTLPINLSNYEPKKICFDFAMGMIESILLHLASQIPEPEGAGGKVQSRLIMNKRISNMKKYVLTNEIRDNIIEDISKMYELIGTINEYKIEELLKEPHKLLVPRGEYYFQEMKLEVETILQEMGDQDLRKELAASTDDPQTLVKQYGNQAISMVGREAELIDLYSSILGLKSTEVMFSGVVSITPLKKKKVTQSLIDDLFRPQFNFLKIIGEDELKKQTED